MSKRKQEEDDHIGSSKKGGGDRRASFVQRLTSLNQQFATWVKEQDDTELWTDGVEDYLRYAKDLVADFSDVLDAAPAANNSAAAAPAAGGFAFGATSSAAGSQPAPSAFLFGALPGTQAAGGGGAAPAAQPFSGFNFGQPAAGGLFGAPSSGALNTLAGGGAVAASAGDDDEEEPAEDEEPSVELESSDAEILSKHRVKLMSQVEGAWKARGPGTLSIRRPIRTSDAGTRAPYLVFTTDTGRVLLSAPLVKGLKPVVQAKQPASLLMMLVNTASGAEEKGMHAFRCESADAAQTLLAQVNSHV